MFKDDELGGFWYKTQIDRHLDRQNDIYVVIKVDRQIDIQIDIWIDKQGNCQHGGTLK